MPESNAYRRLLGRLKLRHFALLRELNDVGNLRQAAANLHMTQPSASKLLGEIEDAVGAPLFVRTRRGMSPTPMGRTIDRWSRVLLSDFGAACQELDAMTSGAIGRLRVGVFPVASPALIPDALAAILASHPDLAVSLHEGSEDHLLPALQTGELDCVVGRLVPETIRYGFGHEVLYEEPTVIVVGPSHPLAHQASVRMDALTRYRWVLPSASAALFDVISTWLGEAGCEPPRVAVESRALATTVALLARTPLISAFPMSQARRFEQLGLVQRLPHVVSSRGHPVVLAYRKNTAHSPALQVFRAALQQACGRTDPE